jgi:hypothetical protein
MGMSNEDSNTDKVKLVNDEGLVEKARDMNEQVEHSDAMGSVYGKSEENAPDPAVVRARLMEAIRQPVNKTAVMGRYRTEQRRGNLLDNFGMVFYCIIIPIVILVVFLITGHWWIPNLP